MNIDTIHPHLTYVHEVAHAHHAGEQQASGAIADGQVNGPELSWDEVVVKVGRVRIAR